MLTTLADSLGEMRLCVVVSSVGKSGRLARLLDSIAGQAAMPFSIGIADQSQDGNVTRIASGYSELLPLFVTRSLGGLSAGRNDVIEAAPAEVTHFAFPNDSSVLPPNLVKHLTDYADRDVIALSYADEDGVRFTFDKGAYPLDRRNVWLIIEPGLVVSRKILNLAGAFDESLGTGSRGSWQSGEGTDLLLRAMCFQPRVEWLPELIVEGVRQDFGLGSRERRVKYRGYGRGYGFLLMKWGYSPLRLMKAFGGPIIRSLVPGSGLSLRDGAYSALGRVEGAISYVSYKE